MPVEYSDLLTIISFHLDKLNFKEDEVVSKINSIRYNVPSINLLFEESKKFFETYYTIKKLFDKKGALIKVYF